MRIVILGFWFVTLFVTSGCSGNAPSTPTSSNPGALQVGGAYQISQTAGDDTCGVSSAPVSFTGTVAHTAGGTTFTLTDTVGTRFSGTVERDGNFVATATAGPDPDGQRFSERLEGRFIVTGFSAALRVDVSPRNCSFTRSWTAAKQGAPNIFP